MVRYGLSPPGSRTMPRRYEPNPLDDDTAEKLTFDDVTILALAGAIIIAIVGVMIWALKAPLEDLLAWLRLEVAR